MVVRTARKLEVSVRVLLVTPSQAVRRDLRAIFARSKWKLSEVPTAAEARSWMTRCGQPSLIICERDLPDGNWKHHFHDTETLPRPPIVIVSSRLADNYLWIDVLNAGGHDVLSTPFDAREASRVVRYASEAWRRQGTNAAAAGAG